MSSNTSYRYAIWSRKTFKRKQIGQIQIVQQRSGFEAVRVCVSLLSMKDVGLVASEVSIKQGRQRK